LKKYVPFIYVVSPPNYKPACMNQRFYSLDVFRGATVALMILVNNPGSWGHIFAPLEHASWHGCTPTDLVFPFFLFAVGNVTSEANDLSKAALTKFSNCCVMLQSPQ